MVKCDNCGKEIGMLGAKYDYVDDEGNPLIYCSNCNRESESIIKIEKNKKNQLEKEKEEKRIKQENEKKMKEILSKNSQWEYKILNLSTMGSGLNATGNKINIKDTNKFNNLGLEGWELVSISPMDSLAARLGVTNTATEFVSCIFKRKL